MAYFSDLSPYRYSRPEQPGVVHVGWLDNVHSFPRGKVSDYLIEKMKALAGKPVELYRGLHICELCPAEVTNVPVEKEDPRYPHSRLKLGAETRYYCPRECMSNGEIRVTDGETIFAAPVILTHYIEAHGYLPPQEFLNAVEMHRIE